MDKRKLYESIMSNVAKEVKKAINESYDETTFYKDDDDEIDDRDTFTEDVVQYLKYVPTEEDPNPESIDDKYDLPYEDGVVIFSGNRSNALLPEDFEIGTTIYMIEKRYLYEFGYGASKSIQVIPSKIKNLRFIGDKIKLYLSSPLGTEQRTVHPDGSYRIYQDVSNDKTSSRGYFLDYNPIK